MSKQAPALALAIAAALGVATVVASCGDIAEPRFENEADADTDTADNTTLRTPPAGLRLAALPAFEVAAPGDDRA